MMRRSRQSLLSAMVCFRVTSLWQSKPRSGHGSPKMSKSTIVVLVVLGLAYAAFALPVIGQFTAYCERVARATGRQKERQEFWNSDDGGMNRFEREQLSRLNRGDYMGLTDPKIVELGAKITRKLRHLLWMAAGIVVTVVILVEFLPG